MQEAQPQAEGRTGELPTPRGDMSGAGLDERVPANVGSHQLAVAHTWVSRGLPVIPCSRTDKGPLIRGFGKDATARNLAPFSDPRRIESWWLGKFRRAHVGILTRSLVVIDLDMRKQGQAAPTGRWDGVASGLDVLSILAGNARADWPETYTVMTPSGGLHLYFQQPQGEPIGCATGDGPTAPHLGPLVDVRGLGGLVIAAGSYSAAQGRPYTRISPADLKPQPLPAWLLHLLRPDTPRTAPPRRPAPVRALPSASRTDRYAAAALTGEAESVAQAVEGLRNRRLFAAARRLGELASTAPAVLDEATVHEQLLAAARAAGQGERESLRTIRSGWNRGVAGAA